MGGGPLPAPKHGPRAAEPIAPADRRDGAPGSSRRPGDQQTEAPHCHRPTPGPVTRRRSRCRSPTGSPFDRATIWLRFARARDTIASRAADKLRIPRRLGIAVARIEHGVLVQAPIGRVWDVVTQAEHLAAWYAFDGAEIDLRPGGAMVFRWREHGACWARIGAVDPPQALSYRSALLAPDEEPQPGNATLVEVSLRADNGATRLRLVQRGFAHLEITEADRVDHVVHSG